MDSARGLRPALALSPDAACALGLLTAALLFAGQGLFDAEGLRAVQDHVITWSFSRRVADLHAYPAPFAYPLPAVLFKLALGSLGPGPSSVLWSATSIGALAATVAGIVRLQGPAPPGRRLLAPTLACAVWVWCIQWDLRAVNANLAFLALALWGAIHAREGRPGLAGALLAASVGLKLYSAPLLLYLAWRRWWPALGATAGFGALLFVVAPVAWFGPADAASLTRAWLGNVVATMEPGFVLELTAYKVSLAWIWIALLGEESTPLRVGLLRAGQAAIAAFVALHLARAGRAPASGDDAAAGERLLVDTGVILGATVLASPLAEPHHGVVALLPASVVARRALAPGSRGGRVAVAVLALTALALQVAPSGTGKAVAFGASLALTLGAASLLGNTREESA